MVESPSMPSNKATTAAGESNPGAHFGKVAVVMGGWSAEREVSLMSGSQVLAALLVSGVDAHAVDATPELSSVLQQGQFDRAFLILHGRGGEDGLVQASLELAGIPYTGSGVLASALCMDKWRAKQLCSLNGVPTPEAERVTSVDEAVTAAHRIGLPVVIKPILEGSSIGVSMVNSDNQIASAFLVAIEYGPAIVEKRMPGIELTATILGRRCLPLVSMEAAGEFYDYDAKYLSDETRYECPVDLTGPATRQIQDWALAAFDTLGCSGWARVDFILDSTGQAQFIECNTAPGMTSHSLVPTSAKAAGISFEQLCLDILSTSAAEQELAA